MFLALDGVVTVRNLLCSSCQRLYDYDKDTRRITFPIKETEKEKMSRLERFKKKDNRCLLYIK